MDLALQVWRAIQFDAVAHDAPELAADGETTHKDDEDALHGHWLAELTKPGHHTRLLKVSLKSYLFAFAQTKDVLLHRTLAQFHAHYD